jgi:hypothetical protein
MWGDHFFCSRCAPFTLAMIHFHSALEFALSFRQLGLAKTRSGRWHASVHQINCGLPASTAGRSQMVLDARNKQLPTYLLICLNLKYTDKIKNHRGYLAEIFFDL